MARILINKQWYEQIEPSTFSELEVEERIILHAPSIYPEYSVMPFKQTVDSTYGKAKPDLVFVSKDYTEWRIVEVEMGYHSFSGHVEDQVQRLADAAYGKREMEYLCKKFPSLDLDKMVYLVESTPPQILVIVNEPKPDWVPQLAKYGAILAVFELFRSEQEEEIFRVNGEYPTLFVDTVCECTFHPFIPRIIEVVQPSPKLNLPPPRGRIKLRFNNCMTEWMRLDAEDKVWLQPTGRNPLNPSHRYELYRQSDNSLVLRPRRP
jgi:hypothetical protein